MFYFFLVKAVELVGEGSVIIKAYPESLSSFMTRKWFVHLLWFFIVKSWLTVAILEAFSLLSSNNSIIHLFIPVTGARMIYSYKPFQKADIGNLLIETLIFNKTKVIRADLMDFI